MRIYPGWMRATGGKVHSLTFQISPPEQSDLPHLGEALTADRDGSCSGSHSGPGVQVPSNRVRGDRGPCGCHFYYPGESRHISLALWLDEHIKESPISHLWRMLESQLIVLKLMTRRNTFQPWAYLSSLLCTLCNQKAGQRRVSV